MNVWQEELQPPTSYKYFWIISLDFIIKNKDFIEINRIESKSLVSKRRDRVQCDMPFIIIQNADNIGGSEAVYFKNGIFIKVEKNEGSKGTVWCRKVFLICYRCLSVCA